MRYAFDEHWTATANFCYNSSNQSISSSHMPPEAFNQLDLTLFRTLGSNAGRLMVGVADLFNETGAPFSEVNTLTSFETPGRTFFARLQINF